MQEFLWVAIILLGGPVVAISLFFLAAWLGARAGSKAAQSSSNTSGSSRP